MERSDKQRKPVAVKNLAELKRFIQPGVEFKTLSQKNHPDLVGLTRVVTTVQTVCFYSKIKDQPNSRFSTDNGGKGFRTDFAKADAYIFDGTTVKVKDLRNKDRGVIYEFEFYDGEQTMQEDTNMDRKMVNFIKEQYLIKHRSIARDVVAHFAKAGLLYEDAEYHNAVFVGTDAEGIPRHAHKRSANSYGKAFRLNVEGSDPRYSFHYIGTDRSLYVFEAPIDMLSFITLYPENWQRHSYVACCGTSIQPVLQMLEQVPQLDTILLCLDNDEAGHQASHRMREQLDARYSVERLIPENKDWNDDLTLNSENAQGLAMNEMR